MVNPNRTGRTLVPGQGANLDALLEVVGDSPNAGSGNAFLLVISGAEPGRLHVLEKPELVIGRSKYADIRISERAMSQQHAKIVKTGEGHRLYDLGSTNGTFVNDQQIEAVDLQAGDVVRTGETVFSYMASGSAAMGTDSTVTLPPRGGRGGRGDVPTATAVQPPEPVALPPGGGGALVLRSQVAPARVGVAPQVIGVPPAAPAEEESDPIGLLIKVLDFLRRYWIQILIFTVLGLGLGVASYKFAKPPAVAKFEVQLIQPPADNMMTRGRRMNLEFFRSAQKSFRRPAIIRASLEALGEENITQNRLRKIHDALTFKQANRREAKDVYEGSFKAATAEEALEYLRVHLEIFIDTEIEKAMKVLLVEVETLEKKLEEANEDLNATEQAVMAFRQEHSEGLPEQAQAIYQEMIALRSAKGQTAGAVTQASETLKVKKKGLSSQAPELQRRIDLAKPYEDSIAEVNQALAEARAASKGPQHPDVIKLKRQKASLEKQRDEVLENGGSAIVKERNPLYEDRRIAKAEAEAQLRIAQSQLSRLTNDMEQTKKLVDALPRLQREYAELTRSYEATQAVHKRVYDNLESSRIQLDLERASAAARYDITMPPNVEPVSKVKTVVMRAGVLGFLGFGFGVFLGLVRDLRRVLATRMAAQRAGRA